jgi:hypothetical protein
VTVDGTDIDAADVDLLLARYNAPADEGPRGAAWAWSALNDEERTALARVIDVFVATYNTVYAVTEDELIPPCWRHHAGLAHELAVQLWLWYWANLDPKATPAIAGDYHGRHLPGFRSRVDRLLGKSPKECRRGDHPDTWRKSADELLNTYATLPAHPERDDVLAIELLGGLHFGFPPDTL